MKKQILVAYNLVILSSMVLVGCQKELQPTPKQSISINNGVANGYHDGSSNPPTSTPQMPNTGGWDGSGDGNVPQDSPDLGNGNDGGNNGSGLTFMGEGAGTVENDNGTGIGDYHKVCKMSIGPTMEIRVLVEATTATHTIEKITVFASGITPGATFEQLGDGTGHYDVVNNAYRFYVYYRVNGVNGILLSKETLVEGVVYLNTGTYAMKRFE